MDFRCECSSENIVLEFTDNLLNNKRFPSHVESES